MSKPLLEASFSLGLDGRGRAFRLDAELTADRGVLVLYGPSGSGKSTVLKALAGLLRPDSGHIRIGERTVYDSKARVSRPAHLRRVGYVPQQRSLLPFLDVWANITFGLGRTGRRRDNRAVAALVDELGIGGLLRAAPATLSGGEAQTVALARALAVDPDLLLLDEPFASVDHRSRDRLLATLRTALERRSVPAVLVTHDREEVRLVADSVARIEEGRTLGQGPVSEMLATPS